VKKLQRMCSIFALISIGLVILAGCPEPAPGRGVIGDISGIVVDSVTLKPLAGVAVQLVGTGRTVTTTANGTYNFNDIPIGYHSVSYTLNGYQFRNTTFTVSAGDYKADDPFAEYEALQGQLAALIASAGGNVTHVANDQPFPPPALPGTVGDVTVEVTQSEGVYDFKEIKKLDYTYTKRLFYLATLTPLSGEVNIKINVAKVSNGNAQATLLSDADFVAIANDVEVWLTPTTAPGFVASTGTGNSGGTIAGDGATRYGPFTTASGSITASELPVGGYTISINAFEQGGLNYIPAAATTYTWGGSSFAPVGAIQAGYEGARDYEVYLFATDGIAFISSFAAGTALAPLNPTGSVFTVTFSEAIDPTTITAYSITPITANIATGSFPAVSPTWSPDGKTVTLTPAPGTRLPFSNDVTKKSGDITLTAAPNGIKAVSGAHVYNSGVAKPVFTVEGIKLTGVDIAPTGTAPSRVVVSATTPAITLTFSKAVSLGNSTFQWLLPDLTTRYNAEFRLSTDKKTVWIYTDLLRQNYDIEYSVVADTDQFDKTGTQLVNAFLGETFSKAREPKLVLRSIPVLWPLPLSAPIASARNYEVGTGTSSPAIVVNFDRAIPVGSTVSVNTTGTGFAGNETVTVATTPVTLTDAANFNVTVSTTGAVSIAPVGLLSTSNPGITYTFSITIVTADGTTIFEPSDLPQYNGIIANVSGSAISFVPKAPPAP